MSGQKFGPNSRYATTDIAERVEADGRVVKYLRRRYVPRGAGTIVGRHAVTDGDRPDLIANATLGDPEQYWRIADANDALHPDELTDRIGRVLVVSVRGEDGGA